MSKVQALLCDDVRIEDSGKFLVIGAYTEMVAVKSFPLVGLFSLLLVLSEVDPGDNLVKVVVKEENDPMPDDLASFNILVNDDGRATLRFHSIEIGASKPSVIEILCGVGDEEMRVIEAIPVKMTEIS